MGGYSIHLRDLQTLSNENWLNDNVYSNRYSFIQIINVCGELAYQKALESIISNNRIINREINMSLF